MMRDTQLPGQSITTKIPDCRESVCKDCTRDTDIIIQSSDNILLGGHIEDLQCSPAFPLTLPLTDGAIVHMPESASVLSLLLQYTHRWTQRRPDIMLIEFDNVIGLAEAAEKYKVFAATDVCKLRIELELPDHAGEVFGYAFRHDYKNIMDKAAEFTIKINLGAMSSYLRSDAGLFAWLRYRERWLELQMVMHENPSFAFKYQEHRCKPSTWPSYHSAVITDFGTSIPSVIETECIMSRHEHKLGGCDKCILRANSWKVEITLKRCEIKAFSSFL